MNVETKVSPSNLLAKDPDWWRGAVIYQIYPRSFQDSNGDGIGDLAGITQRLPYIADLGVDAIWISPFFTSPMKDFGYDVSNYCDVDPMFGNLADFDAMLSKAHDLGLKVMIDLVLSHTSDQHPWFTQSRADRTNDKADWYVWADPQPDGTPPNNWLSIFGGSAWQWDARRLQYYLHNFLTSQPDLNFHTPAVQDALLDVARFWLDRGVDGFRLDTINFYVHDARLRNNPPLAEADRNSTIAPAVNPYNHQDHHFDKNQPENLDFLRRLRGVMNPYNAAAVGEVGDAQRGLEILGEYTAGDDLMHMCYAFEFLANARPDGAEIQGVMDRLHKVAPDGWPCWAFSNHDVQRHASRWDLDTAGLRAMVTLMMCLRGSACIYQGEELGLGEADVAYEDLQDPYGLEFWPEFKGRDGCRTPMVWESQGENAGFGAGKPWLPVGASHTALAADTQSKDPTSLHAHYRAAIGLRRGSDVLQKGDQSPIQLSGSVLTFTRSLGQRTLWCAFNLGAETAPLPAPPDGAWADLAAPGASAAAHTLDAWAFCIMENRDG